MISRHPERAEYDWRGFAAALRGRLANDGRGYRALADEIGVTVTDLSRAASGQMVSVGKVFAICDWMELPERRFYFNPSAHGRIGPAGLPCAGAPDDRRAAVAAVADDPASTKSTRCTGSNVKQEARP
ncbi:hypothetical protein [Aquibium oceanicum]|uniref:Uncharacterized protein n=1 Tax=Aquibium oceanicum TaxID=1670800 RepID=A0A1L3SPV3_9HYPH|nr:hypothetical protein [Aquibium oceanicum]APH71428.1 hypothetical protein BSQ44_08650 [Aquibium oceanicum]